MSEEEDNTEKERPEFHGQEVIGHKTTEESEEKEELTGKEGN